MKLELLLHQQKEEASVEIRNKSPPSYCTSRYHRETLKVNETMTRCFRWLLCDVGGRELKAG